MASVVHPDEVEPRREGNAEVRTTFHAGNGCERLEQRVVRVATGRSPRRRLEDQQEILYVVEGRGTLDLDGETHALEPDMGVYIARGETYAIDADDGLTLVSVVTPADCDSANGQRKVTVRFADQPELDATSVRTFRYLVNEEAGCPDVTQFLGIVQPSKAAAHHHPYDEVGYIVEGEGIAHIDGAETPIRAGSCFHLEPRQPHTIENSGTGPMRILGVFHPSGSPAEAYEEKQ
ncbi:MAG: cupin domain-containing protein [Actinobacteria bacterium]|nr:MAG: cupin domain-containing protein [Actinomycetota bacterium]